MFRKSVALITGLAIALSATVSANDKFPRPQVPVNLEVDAQFKLFLVGHAIGTQNWMCVVSATGVFDWVFIGPQATVFDETGEQILTHYQSKNPDQGDSLHAEWQSSRDTSGVWAVKDQGSLDANYVRPGAIEWLRLVVTGIEAGPTGGDKLTKTKFIQRINTIGGIKPPTAECYGGPAPNTLNTRRLVYYEADYYFYR